MPDFKISEIVAEVHDSDGYQTNAAQGRRCDKLKALSGVDGQPKPSQLSLTAKNAETTSDLNLCDPCVLCG